MYKFLNFIAIFLAFFVQLCVCNENFCKKVNDEGHCVECEEKYVFFPKTNVCVHELCRQFDIEQGKCTKCQNGYVDGVDCKPFVDFCSQFEYQDNKSSCSKCMRGFTLKNNTCLRTVPNFNCLRQLKDGSCIRCRSDLVLTSDLYSCLPKIKNCEIYTRTNIISLFHFCKNCLIGYEQSGKDCTLIVIENCLEMERSNPSCKTCQNDYVLTSDKKKCLPKIENCIKYWTSSMKSKNMICIQCAEGFQRHPLSCKPKPMANCALQPKDEQICTTCNEGYVLTNDSTKCLPATLNCLKYADSNKSSEELTCVECKEGYHSEKGDCLRNKIQFCQEYETTLEYCNQCLNEFELTTDKKRCLAAIPFCLNYTPSDVHSGVHVCIECHEEYSLKNDICTPNEIPNCLEKSDSEHLCLKCETRFQLTDDSKACLPEIQNCSEFEISDKNSKTLSCKKCKQEFELSFNICSPKIQSILNCKVFDKKNRKCEKCKKGFVRADDHLSCHKKVQNCQKYSQLEQNSQTSECFECLKGFYLKNSECVKFEVENCVSLNSDKNACFQCEIGFLLIANGQKCLREIPECKKYSENLDQDRTDLTCIECSARFELKDKVCVEKVIANCLKIDENGICSECQKNFVLSPSKSFCVNQISFCLESYFESAESTKLSCKSCHPEFDLVFNLCFVKFCVLIDNNRKICQQCSSGFVLSSDSLRCFPGIKHCSNYSTLFLNSTEIQCDRCDPGFKLKHNLCEKIEIDNCSKIDNQTHQCALCHVNFRLTDDKLKCLQTIPDCSEFLKTDSSSLILECRACRRNFRLSKNGTCLKINKRFCRKFDKNGHCLKCQLSYTVSNSECLPKIENCKAYDDNQKCSRCSSHFSVGNFGASCFFDIKNCVSYNTLSGFCEKCENLFVVSSDGEICLESIKNCDKYEPFYVSDIETKCERCSSEYLLEKTQRQCTLPKIKKEKKANFKKEDFECLKNWNLTDDGKKCLPIVEYCTDYESSNEDTRALRCAECEKNYEVLKDLSACIVSEQKKY